MFRCGSSSGIDSDSNSFYTTQKGHDNTNAFAILFDVPGNANAMEEETTNIDPYTYYSSSSSSCSSPVDCTLSLGSASTRQSSANNKSPIRNTNGSSCMPTIYWDILSQAKQPQSPASSRATGYTAAAGGAGGDSLLSRRCANCDTTSTPLWRNGPRGPKSLCNACGIRYKKEERRAAATAATYTSSSPSPIPPPTIIESQHRNAMNYGYTHDHPWAHAAPVSATRMRSAKSISMSSSSGRLSDDNDGEDNAMPYYSWCLNAPPSSRADFLHP